MSDARARRPTRLASTLRSATHSERALTIAGAAVVAVVLLATIVLPYLDERRRIATEIPQPYPLVATSLVEMRPRQQACSDQIGLLPGRQVAEMRVGTFGKAASPLRVTLIGSGYREPVSVPATYGDNSLLDLAFRGPAKVLEGSVCVANLGRTQVALYASADRTKSRSTTTVNGRLWPSNFDLAFYAARRESLIESRGVILRRLRLFHAHVGLNLLRLLAVLFVLGIPLATVGALVATAARRRREPTPLAPNAARAAGAP